MEHYHFEELVEEQDKLNVIAEVGSVDVNPHNGRVVIVEAEARHMDLSMNRNGDTDKTRQGPGSRLTGNLGSGEGRIAARIVTGSLHLENLKHPVPSA